MSKSAKDIINVLASDLTLDDIFSTDGLKLGDIITKLLPASDTNLASLIIDAGSKLISGILNVTGFPNIIGDNLTIQVWNVIKRSLANNKHLNGKTVDEILASKHIDSHTRNILDLVSSLIAFLLASVLADKVTYDFGNNNKLCTTTCETALWGFKTAIKLGKFVNSSSHTVNIPLIKSMSSEEENQLKEVFEIFVSKSSSFTATAGSSTIKINKSEAEGPFGIGKAWDSKHFTKF